MAYTDIHEKQPATSFREITDLAGKGLYRIPYSEIAQLPEITDDNCFDLLEKLGATDISGALYLYLKNLSDLYRRRYKYEHILRTQPFPNADQISPRSLLEYGKCDDSLLATWLEWRKWIFDIDNRSGQETGYVFEPILASCLGGTSVSHTSSPVKRINDRGKMTNEGRQVDCYIEDAREVYELKMRVTIAASGQAAWDMLYEKAGREMSLFIRKYIYPPVQAMGKFIDSNPKSIRIENNGKSIDISDGRSNYEIGR